jgi:hypothetical protein
LQIDRVLGRSCIVVLCSHFERYFYNVNDEIAAFAAGQAVLSNFFPEALRLCHSQKPIDELARMDWPRRREKLQGFVSDESWLWKEPPAAGALVPSRLLAWMKAPKPRSLVRYYRYWGINDVFGAITRTPHTRGALRLQLHGLVDKRNGIAHGDLNETTTRQDVTRYRASVLQFCDRADRLLARQVRRLFGTALPW